MKSMRIAAVAALLGAFSAGWSFAGFIDHHFDAAPFSLGADFYDGVIDGWGASTNAVVVTNSAYSTVGQSIYLAGASLISNNVSQSGTRIWTDLRVRPVFGVPNTVDLPTNSASVVLYFDSSRFLGVYDPRLGNFVVCSNTVMMQADGDSFAPAGLMATNDFSEISIFQDFARTQAVIFVNGVAVIQDLPFVSNRTDYGYFILANKDESNGWMDDVRVQTDFDALRMAAASNINDVAGTDAAEVQTHGHLGRTLYVGGDIYDNLTDAIADYRVNDTLHVLPGVYTGNITISTTLQFAGGPFTIVGDLTVESGWTASSLSSIVVSGDVSVASTAHLAVTGDLTVSNGNIVAGAGATVEANAVTTTGSGTLNLLGNAALTAHNGMTIAGSAGITSGVVSVTGAMTVGAPLTLGSGATNTVIGSLNVAGTITVGTSAALTAECVTTSAGDIVLLENATLTQTSASCMVNSAGDITLAIGSTLTADGGIDADSMTITSGNVFLAGGETATLSGTLTLEGSGKMTAANESQINTEDLAMSGTSKLIMTDAGLKVPDRFVELDGTFTIYGNRWPSAGPVELPFKDDFEIYVPGQKMMNYGFFGWHTAHESVVVTNNEGYPGTMWTIGETGSGLNEQALILPDGTTISNLVDSLGHSNVWTTCYIRPNAGVMPPSVPTNTASFLGFVNTNGYFEVAHTGGWHVCSAPVASAATNNITKMTNNNDYARIDINVNTKDRQYALFVNGVLVAQEMAFPGSATLYTSFVTDSNSGDAYLDNVEIDWEIPENLELDTDGFGLPDGYEIHQYGKIGKSPLGSLFKFE